MRYTLENEHYNTTRNLYVTRHDGRLSKRQVALCWRDLSGVPGDGSGPCGETGPFPHPEREGVWMVVYEDDEGFFIGPWTNRELASHVEIKTPISTGENHDARD